MTEHDKIKQKLEALVDNELNESERKIVEEHVAHCSVCQKEVALLRKLHQLAKETAAQPKEDFLEALPGQVWQKIRQREGVSSKPRYFWVPRLVPILASAAAIVLVVFIGLKYINTLPKAQKPTGFAGAQKPPTVTGELKEQIQPKAGRIEIGKAAAPPSTREAIAATGTKEKEEQTIAALPEKKTESTQAEAKKEIIAAAPATGTGEAKPPTVLDKGEEITMSEATPSKEPETIEKPMTARAGSIQAKVDSTKGQPETELLAAEPAIESAKIESIRAKLSASYDKISISAKKPSVLRYWVVGGEPEPVEISEPEFPKSLPKEKIKGEVVIKAVVGLKGQVEYAEVLKSSGNGVLDTAALKAAQKSIFKPVVEKGKKVRAWTTLKFQFPIPKNK